MLHSVCIRQEQMYPANRWRAGAGRIKTADTTVEEKSRVGRREGVGKGLGGERWGGRRT